MKDRARQKGVGVLVVENERLLAKDVSRQLTEIGYNVVGQAATGERAVEIAKASGPDLVLMDVKLDGPMDGIEAARLIKEATDAAIVYLTGYSDPETVERLKETNPHAYLSKPVSPMDLARTIDIALYKLHMERELKKSHDLLDFLINALPVGVVYVDKDRKIRFINESSASWWAISPQDVSGRDVKDLLGPENYQDATKENMDLVLSGREITYEKTTAYPDGKKRNVSVYYKPDIRNESTQGFIGLITDITEFRRIEEDLRIHQIELEAQNEELKTAHAELEVLMDKYQDLYDFAPNAYISLDSEGLFQEANLTTTKLLGTERIALLGKPFHRWIHRDSQDSYHYFLRLLNETNQGQTCEVELKTKEQGEIYAKLVGAPIFEDNGTTPGYRIIIFDITEEKKAEELALQKEKYKAVADISAGIAHNFNNLLQVLLGNIDLAISDLKSGAMSGIKEKLLEMKAACKFAAGTIKRLNHFVRNANRNNEEEDEIFDLSELVSQVVEISKPIWKDQPQGTRVTVFMEETLDPFCMVKGNRDEIFKVVLNLIKNSVEALPKGGKIEISVYRENDGVILCVKDNGIGIPDANISRLFTPFFTTHMEAGRGLGLSTCNTIVNSHMGTISVNSRVGRGTSFYVRLPYVDASLEYAETPGEASPENLLNILAIDDSEFTVRSLKKGLERMGNRVFTALSGEQGLAIMENQPIDVVICDLGMPKMDGWQVGEEIKKLCKKRGRPRCVFIILTGWGGQDEQNEKMELSGVDAILEKPVDLRDIYRVISNAYSQKNQS